jgi:hypothetical protein
VLVVVVVVGVVVTLLNALDAPCALLDEQRQLIDWSGR